MLLSRELHYLCLLLLGHSQMLVLGVGDTSETNPLLSCSNGRLLFVFVFVFVFGEGLIIPRDITI